jgi:hypothetical protein
MDKTPFTIAAEQARQRGAKDTAQRIVTEGRIARKIVDTMLSFGMTVGVNDGEETVLKRSTSVNDIMQALFSTDEDYIIGYGPDGKKVGVVYLVYGNSGWDVINDYSTSLELVMQPVNNYADSLDVL